MRDNLGWWFKSRWVDWNLFWSGFWLRISNLTLNFHEKIVLPQAHLHSQRALKAIHEEDKRLETYEHYFGEEEIE